MKKVLIILFLILFICCYAGAADYTGTAGQPIPDFTVTDSQGNAFSLYEALLDHEAVLISIRTTQSRACRTEIPFLNDVYEQYGGRVAMIALTPDPADTPEAIEAYREAEGVSFPMGRDEDAALYRYLGAAGVPTTVIVDRFGNAGCIQTGCFISAEEAMRTVGAFLDDDSADSSETAGKSENNATVARPVSLSDGDRIPAEAYIILIIDQNNTPVPGAIVNFCTDTACTVCQSDKNGMVIFSGLPDTYHVQLLKVPKGYSFDTGFEMYTESQYGEWALTIRKD